MALASRNEILEEKRPTSLEFNSPSVGILSQRFLGPGKFRVLDLGAPTKSTLAFFSASSCTYYVEDLNRFFIEPRKQGEHVDGEDDDVAGAVANALGYEESARFDLVLGWDLFSYMDRAAIEILMSRVARFGLQSRVANFVVTNVPGPKDPVYLLGARMLAAYPVVPPWSCRGSPLWQLRQSPSGIVSNSWRIP